MLKKIIAFTLSEVLLVAAIVGVVASLSVPNLKKSHDNKVLIAKGKAVMTKLEAALQQVSLADVIAGSAENASEALLNEMSNHLKLVANCGKIANENYCFTKDTITNGTTLGNYNLHTQNSKCSSAILNDNTEFAVCIVSLTPVENSTVLDNGQKYYGYIVADVNGVKKQPNTRARDVYYYLITEYGGLAVPDGTSQSNYEIKTFKDGF